MKNRIKASGVLVIVFYFEVRWGASINDKRRMRRSWKRLRTFGYTQRPTKLDHGLGWLRIAVTKNSVSPSFTNYSVSEYIPLNQWCLQLCSEMSISYKQISVAFQCYSPAVLRNCADHPADCNLFKKV